MTDPNEDLLEIKSMMAKSTRFLSLSGSSGVLLGIYATGASMLAYQWLYPEGVLDELSNWLNPDEIVTRLIILASVLVFLSLSTSFLLSRKRAKKNSEKLWTPAGKRFLSALFLPLLVGGGTILAQLYTENYTLIAGTSLIFYGLALLNAASFTVRSVRHLGMVQVILGLIAHFYPEFSLLFWWVGFGLAHIVYGTIMYLKYEK